jgi:hypothetical protein
VEEREPARLDGELFAELVLDQETGRGLESELADELGGRPAVQYGTGLPRERLEAATEAVDVLPRPGVELLPPALQEHDSRPARSGLERQAEPRGVAPQHRVGGVEELTPGLRVLIAVEGASNRPYPASDHGPAFEHPHVEARPEELVSRDQACEARPDHDDARAPPEGTTGTEGQGRAHRCGQELTPVHGGID